MAGLSIYNIDMGLSHLVRDEFGFYYERPIQHFQPISVWFRIFVVQTARIQADIDLILFR